MQSEFRVRTLFIFAMIGEDRHSNLCNSFWFVFVAPFLYLKKKDLICDDGRLKFQSCIGTEKLTQGQASDVAK